jgi:lactose/L-arabinose transport system ATP-binding protein
MSELKGMQLELKDIAKSFGSVKVIEGVDLQMEAGEFTVFVGPSGCGKSTLLRMISGLDDPSSGEILIDGQTANHKTPSERRVAMVFQSYALYPHMTVRENIDFALRVHGMSSDEVKSRTLATADSLQLTPFLDRKPSELSGGQKQRVAIGRAIVREPQLFLFDEPLSNLDAELRVQMRLELAELHKRLGVNMIYVTHDQVEAMTLADRIVILNAGKIAQHGSPKTLYNDPDSKFVAGFLGSPKMNFLDAQLETASGTTARVSLIGAPDVTFDVPCRDGSLEPGTPVSMGVRPEYFSETGDSAITVNSRILEDLGGIKFAYCTTNFGQSVTLTIDRQTSLDEGATFDARFDAADVLLFAENGDRIR